MTKPPIGLMPRWLHEEINFDDTSSYKRLQEIESAIERYQRAGKQVPDAWWSEKEQIVNANQ